MDTQRLAGKNILITGAAQGMGAANAECFAEQGANVCIGDINFDGVQAVAERINAAGNGQAVAVRMDVTSREDNAAAVARTVEVFGSINVALLNAGVNKPRMFMDIDEDNWDMVMNINAKGVLLGMQEAARQMIAQGRWMTILTRSFRSDLSCRAPRFWMSFPIAVRNTPFWP